MIHIIIIIIVVVSLIIVIITTIIIIIVITPALKTMFLQLRWSRRLCGLKCSSGTTSRAVPKHDDYDDDGN